MFPRYCLMVPRAMLFICFFFLSPFFKIMPLFLTN